MIIIILCHFIIIPQYYGLSDIFSFVVVVILAVAQPAFFYGFLRIGAPTGEFSSFQKSFYLLNASSCEWFPKAKWHFRSNDKCISKIEYTPGSFLGQSNILVRAAGLVRGTNGQMQLLRAIATSWALFFGTFLVSQSAWPLPPECGSFVLKSEDNSLPRLLVILYDHLASVTTSTVWKEWTEILKMSQRGEMLSHN